MLHHNKHFSKSQITKISLGSSKVAPSIFHLKQIKTKISKHRQVSLSLLLSLLNTLTANKIHNLSFFARKMVQEA